MVGGGGEGEGGGGWARDVTIYSPILGSGGGIYSFFFQAVSNTSTNSNESGESLLTLLCM